MRFTNAHWGVGLRHQRGCWHRHTTVQDLCTSAPLRVGGNRALVALHLPCGGAFQCPELSLTRGQVYRQGLLDLDKGKVTQSFIDGGLYRVVTLYAVESVAHRSSSAQCFDCIVRGSDPLWHHLLYAAHTASVVAHRCSDTPGALLLCEGSLPILHRQLHCAVLQGQRV